ncbi:hypothetical protein PCANC_27042, partial [Puccinia coronata f. sp. avenae]
QGNWVDTGEPQRGKSACNPAQAKGKKVLQIQLRPTGLLKTNNLASTQAKSPCSVESPKKPKKNPGTFQDTRKPTNSKTHYLNSQKTIAVSCKAHTAQNKPTDGEPDLLINSLRASALVAEFLATLVHQVNTGLSLVQWGLNLAPTSAKTGSRLVESMPSLARCTFSKGLNLFIQSKFATKADALRRHITALV